MNNTENILNLDDLEKSIKKLDERIANNIKNELSVLQEQQKRELDNLNNSKKASKSMITFLVLNTTGLTLFPTTIISLRYLYKSSNPEVIIKYCFLSTLIGTIGGLIVNYLLSRRYKS